MPKLTVVTHYPIDDTQCRGDYWYVTIHNGEATDPVVQRYGDSYHDKGKYKAEGYTDAFLTIFPDCDLDYVNVADAE